MDIQNETSIRKSTQLEADNGLVFQNKKERLVWAIKVATLFSPFIYIFSLLDVTPLAPLGGFFYGGNMRVSELYEVSILSSVLTVVLVAVGTFLTSKDIPRNKVYKFITLMPLGYFLTIVPILLFYVYVIIASLQAGGEQVLGAGVGFIAILLSLGSVLPIIFLGFLVYLWKDFKKVFAVTLYILGLAILTFYVFTKVIIGGCYNTDTRCFVEKALELKGGQSEGPALSHGELRDPCAKARFPGSCYQEIARYDKNPSISLCESITPKNSITSSEALYYQSKNSCYQYVAVKAKNISVCDKMEGSGRFVVNKELDVKNCKALVNQEFALQNNDESYCGNIEGDTSFNDGYFTKVSFLGCNVAVALKTNNLNVCEKITLPENSPYGTQQSIKEMCYYDYSLQKKDCSLVSSSRPALKVQCEQSLSR